MFAFAFIDLHNGANKQCHVGWNRFRHHWGFNSRRDDHGNKHGYRNREYRAQ